MQYSSNLILFSSDIFGWIEIGCNSMKTIKLCDSFRWLSKQIYLKSKKKLLFVWRIEMKNL